MVVAKDQSRLDLRRYSFSQRTAMNEWNELSSEGGRGINVNMLRNISWTLSR